MHPRITLLLALLSVSQMVAAFPWYASGDNFRGAKLMTPEERKQHVSRLQSMRSFSECKDYMHAHYVDLDKRAQAANVVLPPVQSDPCEVMRTMGRFR